MLTTLGGIFTVDTELAPIRISPPSDQGVISVSVDTLIALPGFVLPGLNGRFITGSDTLLTTGLDVGGQFRQLCSFFWVCMCMLVR